LQEKEENKKKRERKKNKISSFRRRKLHVPGQKLSFPAVVFLEPTGKFMTILERIERDRRVRERNTCKNERKPVPLPIYGQY